MARGISTATIARRTGAIALAATAAAGLSACGVGQVTQTDSKQSAIAGVNVDAGDLALRDLQVEYPSPEGYESGADAPLRVWIGNGGDAAVSLVAVTTDAAATVALCGDEILPEEPLEETDAPGGEAAEPAPGPGCADSFEIEIGAGGYERLDQAAGDYLVLEGLTGPLSSGQDVEVEFQFSNGETVAATLPVGQALEPGDREYQENPGFGH